MRRDVDDFIDNLAEISYHHRMGDMWLTILILGATMLLCGSTLGALMAYWVKQGARENKEMTMIAEQRVERVLTENRRETMAILKEIGVKTYQIFERVDQPPQSRKQ